MTVENKMPYSKFLNGSTSPNPHSFLNLLMFESLASKLWLFFNTRNKSIIVITKIVFNSFLHLTKNIVLLSSSHSGKSVLNQKSELQRAYEKQRERQQRQQHQEDLSPTAGLKAELNRVIMERAQKHERQEGGEDEEDKQYVNPEYLNARAKLRQQRASELK